MGSRRREQERFAKMPQSLLQHPAVATLPHAAFKVLVILACGAWPPGIDRKREGGRNGVQAITDAYARRFGISSRDTVYRAIDELLERGLIVRTREGWKSKTHFALYAVAWLPVTHRNGEPLAQAEPAPRGFDTWKPILKPKKNIAVRSVCRPMNGHDADKFAVR